MLYLILCYFLLTCACLWAGLLMYSFIPGRGAQNRSVIHFLITGLIGLTAVGQWIVLFFPLTLLSLVLILSGCVVITLFRKKFILDEGKRFWLGLRNLDRMVWVCGFCFLIMILTLNAGPTMMDDTDSYHIQMVKWIQEFGSVPGIANLHLRFGFNSSWFVSIGLLTWPLHGLNTYLSLNGILSLWFCYFMLEKIFKFLRKDSLHKSVNPALGCLVILVLGLVNWAMIRGCATSCNYDFISTCCIVILFFDLTDPSFKPDLEWLIWPVYLFTVRMMNFPLLLFSLFYFWPAIRRISIRRFLACVFAAFFLVVPFIARNLILSGYAFFPVYQLDWFSFDWKADKSSVAAISEYIKYFNRVNPAFRSLAETSQLSFPRWIGNWFTYLFPFDKLLIVLSFFGYGFVLVWRRRILSNSQRKFMVVMIIQLICWFIMAPDPRFAQGAMLFGIYMAIQEAPALPVNLKNFFKYSTGLLAGLVLFYSGSKMVRDKNYRNLLSPHPLPVPAVQTLVLGHIQLHIPSRVLNNWNPRCYDVALPCLYKLDPRVEARGKGIGEGFRIRPGSRNIQQEGEYKIKE